jgi:putative ABC transport system permease protein
VSSTFLLARRYLAFHRGRTLILVSCIALTCLLPLAVEWLVGTYSRELQARAAATPLVVGRKGSRFDLVLNTLYFRGRVPEPLGLAEVDRLLQSGYGTPIPVLARNTAGGYPLVGASPEYHRFRGLRARSGRLPVLLGECAVGAEVAARSGLGVDDRLLTDRDNLYAIDQGYPLKMRVVGVLADSGTPDDRAVFASLETVWIAEGIGHGHGDARTRAPEQVIRKDGQRIVLDSSVVEFQEITPENIDTFHFHEDREQLPVTAVIVVPKDARSATILKGRYRVAEREQLLEPGEVVAEISDFVFRLKAFFDANVALVAVATAMFLGLIVALSVRVRRREFETLRRIGCARGKIVRLVATELALIVAAGVVVAAALAAVLVRAVGAVQDVI